MSDPAVATVPADGHDELPPPPPSPYAGAPLASVWTRAGELALEAVLFGCALGVGWVVWWIIAWDYGKTPARSLLHTRAVRAGTRSPASFGRLALREGLGKGLAGAVGAAGLILFHDGVGAGRYLLAASLAYCAMSAVAALLDNQRRALWDVLAGTVVVVDPLPAEPGATAVADDAISSEAPGTERS